jgi:DtxR family Mn-dependent transcriptional regulator
MEAQAISAVQEDYLEAILALEAESPRVRVRDLADRLSVHKSTVTAALKALAEKGLIEYEPYGQIVMTRVGRRAGERVSADHAVVKAFLTEVLMIDEQVAEDNACRMEHVMDRAVLNRLMSFTACMTQEPRPDGLDCREAFKRYLKTESA